MPNRVFWIVAAVITLVFTPVLMALYSLGTGDPHFFSAKTIARATGVVFVVVLLLGFIMRRAWPLTERSPILGWTIYMILVGLCAGFMRFLMFGDPLRDTRYWILAAVWYPLAGVLFGSWMRRRQTHHHGSVQRRSV